MGQNVSFQHDHDKPTTQNTSNETVGGGTVYIGGYGQGGVEGESQASNLRGSGALSRDGLRQQPIGISLAGNAHISDGIVAGGDVYHNVVNHFVVNPPDSSSTKEAELRKAKKRTERLLKEISKWLAPNVRFRKVQNENLEKWTAGTLSWFIEGETYRSWKEGGDRIIWGSGMPGAGKTILASRAIHDLEKHQKTSTKKVCVVFAYCRYTEPLTVNDILEALVKQFLECDPSLVAVVEPLYSRYSLDDSARPTQEELLELVKQLETHFDIVYYVIDGLDEARMDTQFDLIEAINNLRGRFSLTSRPLKSLAMDLRNARFYPITANASDILLLVAKKITRNPGFRRLLEQNHLTQELVVKILAKSSGMFLHAALQIEMIHKCVDVSCVKKNLSRFPERLQDLYDMAMDRINDQIPHNAMLANHVLLWLVFGCAALTLTDLQYALSATYDGDVHVDADGILSLCCGLVHIEKTNFVRLIHFTAKDALGPILKEKTFPNPHGILFRATTKRLMEFNILNNAKPEKDLFERLLSDHPMLRYSYDHWSSHALECMSDSVYAAEVMQVVKLCVSYPCMELGWDGMEHLHPLHVVARYGFHDLVDEVVTEVAKGDLSLRTQGNLGATALILASEYGHVEVVNRLLQFNRWTMIRSVIVGQSRPGMHLITAQVNLRDNLGGTALMRAASSGRLEAVQRLLDDPEIDVNLQDHDGRTALMHASPKAIVPLLERQDIQVNIQDNKGYTALMKASEYGGRARIIVQHLVQHKDIQINLRNQKGDTALMCAAAKGRSRNVKLLLQHEDIDVNAESGGWTALMLAAKNGDEETVRALLDFEATDVNARTKIYGSTALMIATIHSHPGVVSLLLQRPDIDPDIAGSEGRTPLQEAQIPERKELKKRREAVLALLLKHKQEKESR